MVQVFGHYQLVRFHHEAFVVEGKTIVLTKFYGTLVTGGQGISPSKLGVFRLW